MPCDPSFTSDALPFLDRLPKPKVGPRLPLRHYCKVCRAIDLSEGWKHQTKQVIQTRGTQHSGGPRGARKLHYTLCAVSCTRADVYAAHMRGVGHQKVSKLYTRTISSEPMPGSVTNT